MLLTISTFSQEKLSLYTCYKLANENYPMAKQYPLFARQHDLDVTTIKTEKFPQLDISAQATYQSDVTQVPIRLPNTTITPPNKDQYKTSISINQLIFDGGFIDASVALKETGLKTQLKQVEVNLYQLKEQINQLFFSILLVQENRALLDAKKTQVEATLKEVKAGVKFGTLLPTSAHILEAELLKIGQQFTELDLNKISLLETLSKLIGEEISTKIILENPEVLTKLESAIDRPELDLFQLQKEQIEASKKLIAKNSIPKLQGFAIGGYGNPGLNMLDNSFQTYYIAGIKLNWNPFDWKASKTEQKSLQISKEIIDNQQEIFTLKTTIELNQHIAAINKISAFIASDKSIIELQKRIVASVRSQLKNGVVNSSTYITELTNLYEAEINLSKHKIQLLLARANYSTTKGTL